MSKILSAIAGADLSLLSIAAQSANQFASMSNGSLTEYTKPTQLNPVVLIDKRVLGLDPKQVSSLMQTLLSIYCGYYLSAVNIAMSVDSVRVMQVLDQFSTDRTVMHAAELSRWTGLNSIDDTAHYLPSYGTEALGDQSSSQKSFEFDKTIHNITEESNLAVGKLLDVKLREGNNTVSIPVVCRLNPKSIEPDDFLFIAKSNSADLNFGTRYHQWRSGEISFFRDFLLCQDLIEADKKAILADKTGLLSKARSKKINDALASLASGYGSPNSISTMVIISKQTASDLELVLKGSLKDTHVRNKYFENNFTMMLIVVDTRMERFTMYQRGIDHYGEYTLDDIKQNSKKANGVNIDDIMRAYNLGNAAQL